MFITNFAKRVTSGKSWVSIVLLLTLCTVSCECSVDRRGPTVDSELEVIGDSFLIHHLGEEYFEEHFCLFETIPHYGEGVTITDTTGAPLDVRIATFNYYFMYDNPRITEHIQFSLDIAAQELWTTRFKVRVQGERGSSYSYDFGGSSAVLLDPQEIVVTQAESIAIALENGVQSPVSPKMIDGPILWANRFQWAICNSGDGPDHFSLIVLVDAETAEVSLLTDYVPPRYN